MIYSHNLGNVCHLDGGLSVASVALLLLHFTLSALAHGHDLSRPLRLVRGACGCLNSASYLCSDLTTSKL